MWGDEIWIEQATGMAWKRKELHGCRRIRRRENIVVAPLHGGVVRGGSIDLPTVEQKSIRASPPVVDGAQSDVLIKRRLSELRRYGDSITRKIDYWATREAISRAPCYQKDYSGRRDLK